MKVVWLHCGNKNEKSSLNVLFVMTLSQTKAYNPQNYKGTVLIDEPLENLKERNKIDSFFLSFLLFLMIQLCCHGIYS
jgi:hypothetical protein